MIRSRSYCVLTWAAILGLGGLLPACRADQRDKQPDAGRTEVSTPGNPADQRPAQPAVGKTAARPGDPVTSRGLAVFPSSASTTGTLARPAPTSRGAWIRGVVIDEDGRGVPGARVIAATRTLPDTTAPTAPTRATDSDTSGNVTVSLGGATTPAPTRATDSDTSGAFAFPDLPRGDWFLTASADPYVDAEAQVTAPAEGVRLRLRSAGATVEGHVYLRPSGRALPDAEVRLSRFNPAFADPAARPRAARSDDAGVYRFHRLPPGRYRIEAAKEPLNPLPAAAASPSILTLRQDETRSGVDLFLYPGHTIRGMVREKGTATPIEGVDVAASSPVPGGKRTRSAPDGTYELTGIARPEGRAAVTLRAEKAGYVLPPSPASLTSVVLVPLPADRLEVVQDIDLVPAVPLTGAVRTADGSPAADALVWWESSETLSASSTVKPAPSVAVDPRGAFSLYAPPFQTLRVVAAAAGYPSAASSPIDVRDRPIEGIEIVLLPALSLAGRVEDPDRRPAAGAAVVAEELLPPGFIGRPRERARTATDSAGRFVLANLSASALRIHALQRGFAPSRPETVALSPDSPSPDLVLALRPAHHIAGSVSDSEGNPLPGSRVSALLTGDSDHCRAASTADSGGRYHLDELADGFYYVAAEDPAFATEEKWSVPVDRDDVDFVLGAEEGHVTLIGAVVDWKTRQPVTDFTVLMHLDREAESDAAAPGVFRMPGLRENFSHTVHIEAPGYRPLDELVVAKSEGADRIMRKTFALGSGGGVVGRVVEAETRKALAGVPVRLRGVGTEWQVSRRLPEATVVTGGDGRFRLSDLSAGSNLIEFDPPAPLTRLQRRVDVANGETVDLGEIELGAGRAVFGVVVSLPAGEPCAGARVDLLDGFRRPLESQATDPAGRYRFSGLANGDYNLVLPDHGLRQWFQLNAAEDREFELRVGNAILAGQVLRAGEPMAASLRLWQADVDEVREANTDGEGRFRIPNLAPGRYQAQADVDRIRGLRFTDSVEVQPAGETRWDLVLPAGGARGRVVDGTENPVGGATVTLAAEPRNAEETIRPRGAQTFSNPDGTFEFPDLPPGRVSLSAFQEGVGRSAPVRALVPERGDADPVVLVLSRGGTLRSIALTMEKKPVPQAWCTITGPDGTPLNHGKTRDPQGVVEIADLAPGTCTVEVSSYGFSIEVQTVEIRPGESTELISVLYDAGALRWTLLRPTGSPMADVPCGLTPNDPSSIESQRRGATDADGLWIVRGLYPGDYTLTCSPPDHPEVRETIRIQAHELTRAEKRLP